MANNNSQRQSVIGMVGLGTMGRNLLLNMADHGFQVVGYDKDKSKTDSLSTEAHDKKINTANTLEDFLNLLQKPRAIMLLVPAGKPVDDVINELVPHLEPGDLIIDGGNSHFTDTDIRSQRLKEMGLHFLGIGISGGEKGARLGPSIMPGGPKEAYERIRSILEAVAAVTNGEPCVTYLGNGSAGHYVKMVHNGIEYGIMQLIAESYDLMKHGLNYSNEQLYQVYASWNNSYLNSYLIEITRDIFHQQDAQTNTALIDKILPVAQQNGTGMWTSQSAMKLQIPVPTIDIAVSMRDLSVLVKERNQAAKLYAQAISPNTFDSSVFVKQLEEALFIGMTLVYAQGFALIRMASKKYAYAINLESVARIWRGGCIIRAKLLETICSAFSTDDDLPNLLLDPSLAEIIGRYQASLRQIVAQAAHIGVPSSAFMATLSYFDAYRSIWSPANLIQAQRDYFGAHRYERNDTKGTFHTEWLNEGSL